MQIGPLGLLIINVVYKLELASNISGLLHLGGLAFEIYILKDSLAGFPLAKGS